MGAIGALSTAAGALHRNPVIVLGVLAISAIGSIGTIGQVVGGTILVVAGSIVGFLLQPLFLGGVLGIAEEGVEGRASIGTILRAGAVNYLTLLGDDHRDRPARGYRDRLGGSSSPSCWSAAGSRRVLALVVGPAESSGSDSARSCSW